MIGLGTGALNKLGGRGCLVVDGYGFSLALGTVGSCGDVARRGRGI